MLKPVIERFLNKISVSKINFYNNTPCWEWIGTKIVAGYGIIIINCKHIRTHRFIYEYYYGEINLNLEIDHLCRNKICSNPNHLEQVTHKENSLRGIGPTAINSRKTHCKRGHEFTTQNTFIYKNNPRRGCRKCMTKQSLEYRQNNIEKIKQYKKQYFQTHKSGLQQLEKYGQS